jgi:cytosine/adenosine deaminase-related metal-dependent hydrolase
METVFRARYVFPVDRPPIEDGVVVIQGDRIASVEPYSGQVGAAGGENTAIVPGFVNSHTHLEFSDLKRPLGHKGMPFVEWIRAVIDYRQRLRTEPERLGDLRWPYARPVEEGLQEAISSGTIAIGDIAAIPPQGELGPVDLTAFLEVRAPRATDVEAQMGAAATFLGMKFDYRHGISPHAPYTVHPTLLDGAIELSRMRNVPLAMHLAESREEIEFLRTSGGPLRELLAERNAWEEEAFVGPARPLDYLQRLSGAPRSLVVHGNYLDAEEIEFMAQHCARMSLVFCPRTHAFFEHEPHPWRKALARGVNVAIATDSRASNPDLNMLEEVRFLVHYGGASPAEALEMATLSGAKALGIDDRCGTLSPGKDATFVRVALPNDADGDPYEWLMHPKSRPIMVINRMRIAWHRRSIYYTFRADNW